MKTATMKLALHGGQPVRQEMLQYGRQWINDSDVAAVAEVLRSDWLTTGPRVAEFETAFAEHVGAKEAVAVCNGTAALHAAMHAVGIGPGDEVIVPPLTFAATANCVVFQGGVPVFADVDADTLLLDPEQVKAKITPRTKAIIAVDFAGQPCNYDALLPIAEQNGLALVADACHALGGAYKDRPVGTLADLSTFSLHAVKHITTGEGGVITTENSEWAQRMRVFRNHGITSDHRQREDEGNWYYEMVDLGHNYRLTDLQCALGISQLQRLDGWVQRRQDIAQQYDAAFLNMATASPLVRRKNVSHAYHLYVVRFNLRRLLAPRAQLFAALRAEGIGVNVHYVPVHLHPFYRRYFGTSLGQYPESERAYTEIVSLPIFPRMSDDDVDDVILAVSKTLEALAV